MAEGDSEVRWDGLCSRDPSTRETALESIRQTVLRKTEDLRWGREAPLRPPDGLSPPAASLDGLNRLLAHLLMLSKRCPFKDVREKSEFILKSVQVRKHCDCNCPPGASAGFLAHLPSLCIVGS